MDLNAALSLLAGPLGGTLGLMLFVGGTAGWKFHGRTYDTFCTQRIAEMQELMKREREECDTRIADLTARMDRWEKLATGGLMREIAQLHDSGVQLIERSRDHGT